ncbi:MULTISPECIES: permease [Cohaesibacter]|uniref:permease n=1 Tax=Cohaesibacter TaxID=655352 RepID=UPI000DE9BD2D|nr:MULTISPECIES: permease [Cohaesibacter]TLP49130.1 permease [Cohaesibacter sp. CAU 1516]
MTEVTQGLSPTWRSQLNGLLSPWTIVILAPVCVAILDFSNLVPVTSIAVKAFLGTLPVIAFAVFLIAYLKAAGAEAMVAEAFKGKETRMIFLAALLGGLAPFCSCEVIPFIAGLLALGAPLSAVMAFWLSSPLIDPPTLLITASALGWPFAVGKAVSAVALGLFGGFVIAFVIKAGWLTEPLKKNSVGCSSCGCGPSPFSGKPVWPFWKEDKRQALFWSELKTNALFLIKWLALAYTLEGLLITYVPASVIAGLVGGSGILPIGIAAFVGIPAYLNSYVAPPLLAGLMEQGMSAGAAMSFMVAGAVSSIPAMAAVWSLVKRRVFALYLGLGVVGAILSGAIFQLFI